eukprot:TRINITY_DN2606_c0_g1_i1.p1 TRINITY_DN2606_c0_g1~~TRINITY_DN2606_c0_g1_i1.p1  ORF type:complete len:258 (+),score=32.66 TRINITY_DN2606_c0_g1_i1:89-775(+)
METGDERRRLQDPPVIMDLHDQFECVNISPKPRSQSFIGDQRSPEVLSALTPRSRKRAVSVSYTSIPLHHPTLNRPSIPSGSRQRLSNTRKRYNVPNLVSEEEFAKKDAAKNKRKSLPGGISPSTSAPNMAPMHGMQMIPMLGMPIPPFSPRSHPLKKNSVSSESDMAVPSSPSKKMTRAPPTPIPSAVPVMPFGSVQLRKSAPDRHPSPSHGEINQVDFRSVLKKTK